MRGITYPYNIMLFAYVCGFLAYVAVSILLVPAQVLMEKLRSERFRRIWTFVAHLIPTLSAGFVAMWIAYSLPPLAKYTSVAALVLTFVVRGLRRMAEEFMSPPEVAGETAGFAAGILLPSLFRD